MHPGSHGLGHTEAVHPPSGVDEASYAVFLAFKRAMATQRQLMLKLLSGESTHPAQAVCLHLLSHRDGASQGELAEILQIAPPTMSTMLKKMAEAGVVERRADKKDQRVTRIHLTSEGHKLVKRLDTVFGEMIRASVDSMAIDDQRELARLLGMLSDNLARAAEDA